MRGKIEGLIKLSLVAVLAMGMLLGAVGRAGAGELVSDKVVNSLLLRAEKAEEPVARERTKAAVGFSLAKENNRSSASEPLVNLGRLKSLGVAGIVLGGLALLAFGAWKNGWRLKPSSSHGSQIRLVSTKALGDKKAIAVVDVEGQRLVVGMTSHQVTLLTSLPGRGVVVRRY
jgi:flagellar biogenesis protein FliO